MDRIVNETIDSGYRFEPLDTSIRIQIVTRADPPIVIHL
jgi:hypothetical protein